ncbi:MAG TPA: tRNA pseudouridine(55) synthase TruB [Gemmatimonadales bacterium]|nr:tRNA pseudouridine(55) synthase TruB [Gemmatimonadales bacterium]
MDKPAGLTSHDVVSRVRRATGTRGVGHTGTLDPFATGLLVVLVGRATRLARFTDGFAKTYRATLTLGVATDTDDATGAVREEAVPGEWPDEAAVRAALDALTGRQWQRPPAYSAKHVEGRRSYALARRGVAVELPEVEVVVHALELLAYAPPHLEFRATVGTGTYVRALGRDLAMRLGTPGHLSALRRERIGPFAVADAVPLDEVGPGTPLRSAGAVVSHLPRVELDEAALAAVRHGRAIAGPGGLTGDVALWHGGDVVAIAEGRDDERLHPVVVLEGA